MHRLWFGNCGELWLRLSVRNTYLLRDVRPNKLRKVHQEIDMAAQKAEVARQALQKTAKECGKGQPGSIMR